MRPLSILVVLLTVPSLAWAAPPLLCALPASTNGPVPSPAGATRSAAPAAEAASTTQPPPIPPPFGPLPPELAGLPFVQHVAASGATISDLGAAHGLRRVAARSGDQFMIFEVAPDGAAAVSGAAVEITPDEIGKIAGPSSVTPLAEVHGFMGLFVRSGEQFQVFYATPDNERLIPGVLWDASGKDVTRQQVAGIPGAVPTVEVTRSGGSTSAAQALPLVEKAAFGVVGASTAPRVYMLIDPQCIYSIRAMQMLKPAIEVGRVQVAVVPLSVLDYEDRGESTRAALALLSKPADQIVPAWQSRDLNNAASPDATKRLQTNMQVAEAIRVRGTPTFLWRKPDGSEGRIDGMPESVPAFIASLGS